MTHPAQRHARQRAGPPRNAAAARGAPQRPSSEAAPGVTPQNSEPGALAAVAASASLPAAAPATAAAIPATAAAAEPVPPAAAAAAKSGTRKKGGDPERRKEYSIHSLMRKLSVSTKAPPPTEAASPCTPAAAAVAAAATGVGETAERGPPLESPDELSLFMFDFGECDAQRCSGRRLLRHAKINRISATGRVLYAQQPGGRRRSSSSSSSSSSGRKQGGGDSDPDSSSDSSSSSGSSEAETAGTAESEDEQEASPAAAAAGGGGDGELVRVRVKGGRFKGILLSPYFDSKTPVFSAADAKTMRQHGLAVVDCSWNRVLEGRRGQQIDFARQNVRVLPLLLCANPTHYGAPNILTCAEALAGALFIAGYRRHADLLLQSFTWGPHFLSLNASFLSTYMRAADGQQMKALKEQQEAELQQQKTDKTHKKSKAQSHDYDAVYSAVSAAETQQQPPVPASP
ncbi:hypothetical protein Efla_003774 [Eimeria flavescens]